MPHIHELIDYCAEAYIVYQNKVLLRYHDKYNIWLSVGGHIELDETPQHAVIREVKEEVGLDISLYQHQQNGPTGKVTPLLPPMYMNIHDINETHKHIALIYFATTASDKITINEQVDASEEWQWLSRQEIESDSLELQPIVKFYALKALDLLSK